VLGVLAILLMLLLPRGVMGIVHDIRLGRHGGRGASALGQWRRWLLGDNSRPTARRWSTSPGVVAAYLVPGHPLLALRRNEAIVRTAGAGDAARGARHRGDTQPDTLVIYSTRWFAVLDQLWQARPRIAGLHVDENWHELGEIRYRHDDRRLARPRLCARGQPGRHRLEDGRLRRLPGRQRHAGRAGAAQPRQRGADAGAGEQPLPRLRPHARARRAGRGAGDGAGQAGRGDRRRRVVGHELARRAQLRRRCAGQRHRRRLEPAHAGAAGPARARRADAPVARLCVAQARVDMGFKHFAFLLGALGGRLGKSEVYAYGPVYGSGGAVVRLL
jgi:2-aminophenol/2-amino-5-chlorophenol 1,6-dioxygenase subunit alpha